MAMLSALTNFDITLVYFKCPAQYEEKNQKQKSGSAEQDAFSSA
jgi:hypothetical protein